MSEEEKIKKLYIDLSTASINKDVNKLNEILSDDYVLVHMTGLKQSKKDYINSVINGDLKYYDCIHESIDVKINGSKASVIGKTKTLASPFGMNKLWWRLKQDLIVEKIDGKWVILYSKASTY